MLKLKASLMKRDNSVEFIGFCGKNVTYEAIKKYILQFTRKGRNLAGKSTMSEPVLC